MDHDEPDLGVVMEHRSGTEPVDQRLAVRGLQHVVEGVLAAQSSHPAGARDEVQVVIAEHGMRPVPQIGDEPQHVEGARATIDKIADEPEPIARGIESATREAATAARRSSPARLQSRTWASLDQTPVRRVKRGRPHWCSVSGYTLSDFRKTHGFPPSRE